VSTDTALTIPATLAARLAPNHIADLRRSGLSFEQIEKCYFVTIKDSKKVCQILRWKGTNSLGSCLGIPYRRPDGSLVRSNEFARLRPDNPRTNAGRCIKYESPKGSTVRLYFPPATCDVLRDSSIPLLITEGEKKSAKADQEGFACLGLGGVEAWSRKREKGSDGRKLGKRELIADFDAVILEGRQVYIVFDSDIVDKVAVQLAEWNLSQALIQRGAIVKVIRLPHGRSDAESNPTKVGLDDFLVAHTADELRMLLGTARPPQDPAERSGKSLIVVTTDEADINDLAIRALSKDESMYQRAGKLVHVVHELNNDSAPRISVMAAPTLRERLTVFAEFVTESDEGELRSIHPPKWCYEAIAARGRWPGIRTLDGVVTAPVMRPDGSVLSRAGYDSQTRLFFEPQGVVFPIADSPNHDDAIKSATSLLEIVKDFPFAKAEHEAVFLAFLLTPLARFAFKGPAPLFLIDANIRGSGKSLLADIVALIVTGREMSRMSNPNDDDEARKRITALAVSGDTLCLIDNIVGGLGCASLDAALTGTAWKDRILGRSEMVEMPLFVTWSATGNNVALQADTSRRVAHIRLDSGLENPEQRDGFEHPNLREYVRQNRPKLLADALTILTAYCIAGRPIRKLPPWGSYEGWSDFIRQALVWCGQPDPGATRTELVHQSDREVIALRELLGGWDELDSSGGGLTTGEVLDRINKHPMRFELVRNAIAELCPAPAGKLPSIRSLGSKLSHIRGRVVGGKHLDRRTNRENKAVWLVCRATAGSAGSDGSGVTNSHTMTDDPYESPPLAWNPAETHPSEPAQPAFAFGSGDEVETF
jgi:hypothetical protein